MVSIYFLCYFILDNTLFQVGQNSKRFFFLFFSDNPKRFFGFSFKCWIESVQYRCVFDILIVHTIHWAYFYSFFFLTRLITLHSVSSIFNIEIHFGISLLIVTQHTWLYSVVDINVLLFHLNFERHNNKLCVPLPYKQAKT